MYNYTQRIGSTVFSVPPTFIEDKKKIVINAKDFLLSNNIYDKHKKYYEKYYCIEMFDKPLNTISFYSKSYEHDVKSLLAAVGHKNPSFKNILSIRPYRGYKAVIKLIAFKVNIHLFRIINLSNKHIKKTLKP